MARPRKSPAEKAITGAGKRQATPSARGRRAASATLKPPAWLKNRAALGVWQRIVPELQRQNILSANDADTFARYCTHFAGWIAETKRIDKEGSTVMVKMTHSEERMPRLHPAVKVREIHEKNLVDIEDRFGGSPLARYRLMAQQAAYPGNLGDLFNRPLADATLPAPASTSAIGVLRQPSQLN